MAPCKVQVVDELNDAVTFQPGAELLADRARISSAVDACLGRLANGVLPDDAERQVVDVKEEAGRRGAGGRLLPGSAENTKAADQLADEVAYMANTPGGGALIVGVENASGDLLGTELDAEWLRLQIYRRIDVAPDVEVRVERGIRLLVISVAEAREPVEDTSDRLRWRVGAASVPVDRGEWWLRRQGRAGWDPMSRPSRFRADRVTPGSVAVARSYLARREQPETSGVDLAKARTTDLLRQLGLLTVDGFLTEAGALLFCAAPRPWVSWTRLDVEGGDILAREETYANLSLLEQIARVEALLEAANDLVTISGEFSERSVRLLPSRAAREAVLNGIVHRDWNLHEPTAVTWVEADSSLTVVSPGGFVGGVNEHNVLTQRFSRSPALADAVRALGLVDKQGIGVDRMFREMVTLGHRPPLLVEQSGPRVRVRLVGGQPVIPVMRLTSTIQPTARQRDVQVALIIYTLLHHPFTTAETLARVLQRTADEAAEALEVTARCVVNEQPVITAYKDTWMLSGAARKAVMSGRGDLDLLRRLRVLWYVTPQPVDIGKTVDAWLGSHDRITSGDYAAMTGLTTGGARGALDRLVEEGLLARGAAAGRNAHYVRSN
jgi:ATP-dependent DNA helicase RecG